MENNENIELIRRHVDIIILKPLLDRDCYGYEILKSIEDNSNGLYSLKQPTLYNCLKRLEAQKKITSYLGDFSNGAQRRYYSLTEYGKQFVFHYQRQWEYTRTILSRLISDKDFDKFNDTPPFNASDLRPLTKRIKNVNVNEFKDEYQEYMQNQINQTNADIQISEMENSNIEDDFDQIKNINNHNDKYINESLNVVVNDSEVESDRFEVENEVISELENHDQVNYQIYNEENMDDQVEAITATPIQETFQQTEPSDNQESVSLNEVFEEIENVDDHNDKYINESLNVVVNDSEVESDRFEVENEVISELENHDQVNYQMYNEENVDDQVEAIYATPIPETLTNQVNTDENQVKPSDNANSVENNIDSSSMLDEIKHDVASEVIAEDLSTLHTSETEDPVDEQHDCSLQENMDDKNEINIKTELKLNEDQSSVFEVENNSVEKHNKVEGKRISTYEDKVDYYQRQFYNLANKKQQTNTEVNDVKQETKHQEKRESDVIIDWSKYTPEERLFKRDEIIKKEMELARKEKLTNKNNFSSSKKLYD